MSKRTHTLVSFDLCPFVQRSAITLQHKGLAHETRYIDLFDKPEWFLAISPFGKVPLLVVEEDGEQTVLFESAVINEYLDEVSDEAGLGRLHPSDPLTRGLHRAWIEYGSALLMAGYQLSMAKDDEALQTHLAATRTALARFEAGLGDGPFFADKTLSLIDTALAPALQRLLWLEALWPELGIFSDTPKVHAWGKHLVGLAAVKKSTVPDIHDRFVAYLQGKGSPTRDVAPSLFGQRAG